MWGGRAQLRSSERSLCFLRIGEDSISVARVMSNLGLVYEMRGKVCALICLKLLCVALTLMTVL